MFLLYVNWHKMFVMLSVKRPIIMCLNRSLWFVIYYYLINIYFEALNPDLLLIERLKMLGF